MDILIKTGPADKQRSACVVVGVHKRGKLSTSAGALDKLSGGYIRKILRKGDIDCEHGQLQWLHNVPNLLANRVLLVGCGSGGAMPAGKFYNTCRVVAKALESSGVTEACSNLVELEVTDRDIGWKVKQATLASKEAVYRFDQLKSDAKKPRRPLKKMTLMLAQKTAQVKAQAAAKQAVCIADGCALTKDLGNLPANICTPGYLAEQAKKLKKNHSTLKVKIVEEAEMKKLGMGSLLSVAQGSKQAARLIIMEHRGGKPADKPVVLVGKAVTFDTGGVSLKPAPTMDEMKFDMCGGASVFGAIAACAQMQLPRNVVGIVPATENMPGDQATRPGDIYTSMSGKTIEVLNTDAEGRLILCDALTYAERFKPKVVIDIATLTGACVIALGHHAAAVYSNRQKLADNLLASGTESGDRCWQMPLWDDYQSQLDSNFADIANIGGRDAGSITAACFLSRFSENYNWAHLDIAGVAWKSGKDKGATGRPVGLLMQYLIDHG